MSRHHRLAPLLGAVALLGSVATASAASLPAGAEVAPDATSVTWGLQPSAGGEPDGRVSLRHSLDAGTALTDEVALTNFGEQPATFAVYGGDGTLTEDGSFDLAAPDQEPTGGGAWITVAPAEHSVPREDGGLLVDVPARSTVALPVEIHVPPRATPGDHPAGVVAELVGAAAGSVHMTSRVGVRVHIRVTGDLRARLTHEEVSASYEPSWNPFTPGTATVTYTVTNIGNVRLGAGSTAAVTGPFGLSTGEDRTQDREILPGESATRTARLATWPWVLARGQVTSTPSVVGEDVVDVPLEVATSAVALWLVPWPQLLALGLLVAAAVLLRRQRRRRAQGVQERIDAAVEAALGQSQGAGGERRPPGGDQPAHRRAPTG
ncbi:MAG TPA: hypothetical protein VKZ83_00095 [Phototrophicaceae bacterium]|nr:hypothetical protein [Phototrophicaceae bacterium]